MGQAKILAIEGLDGVGKTTLAQRLASEMGVEYLKGGGWFKDSPLAKRSQREDSRDRYFSLMQMKKWKEIKAKLEIAHEGIVGVVDRFILVDVAHILSLSYNERIAGFSEEALLQARQSLSQFIPEGVFGILLDVSDKRILETRIRRHLGQEGVEFSDSVQLQQKGYLAEVDTLRRFEAKRVAWLWCARELDWEIINADGSAEEVYRQFRRYLEAGGFWSEGQRVTPEGRSSGSGETKE